MKDAEGRQVSYIVDVAKLREDLTVAGNSSDGHVTNGSLNAQMEVLKKHFAPTVIEKDTATN